MDDFFFKNQLVTASGSGEDCLKKTVQKEAWRTHLNLQTPQMLEWSKFIRICLNISVEAGLLEDELSLQKGHVPFLEEGYFLPSVPFTSPWVRADRARSMHSGSSSQGSMTPPDQIPLWKFLKYCGWSFYFTWQKHPPFGFPKWTNCGILVGVNYARVKADGIAPRYWFL